MIQILTLAVGVLGAFGLGYVFATVSLGRKVQRLNAARAAAQTSALETPASPEDLETRSMLRVIWALTPLSKEAALRIINAAHQRFVVAPTLEAERLEKIAADSRMRERQLLFVAAQAQQEKAS